MLLPYIGHAVLGRLAEEGAILDAFAIPSAAAITPYFGDSTAIVTRQTDGLLMETRNGPPVIAMLSLLSIYRTWKTQHDFEMIELGRRRNAPDNEQAQLGPVENQVVPAAAEKPQPIAPVQPVQPKGDQAEPSPYRKLAPIFLKALIPENLQQMIPDSTLRKLENGPSPATLERREDARRRREERRQQRMRPTPIPPRP